MEITYENIKPLIKKEELVGNQIQLEFCAKNQDIPTPTVAVIVPDQKEIKNRAVKDAVKSSVKRSIISQLFNLIGIRRVGGSIARTAVRNVGSSNKSSKNYTKTKVTQENKEKAIVEAFQHLSSMYNFNEQSKEWEYTMGNNAQ